MSLEEACASVFEGRRYLAEVLTNLTRQSLPNTGIYWQEAHPLQVNSLSASTAILYPQVFSI